MTRTARVTVATALACTSLALGVVGPAQRVGAEPPRTTDIVGPSGTDYFGERTLVLSNGNFVVADEFYDFGATDDVGAVYLYNGATNTLISTLTGSTAGDKVGYQLIEVGQGNFVVASPNWRNPAAAANNAGAVTWVDGVTGLNGAVTATNSLVGSRVDDGVGEVTVLTNGNYVVHSPSWDNGALLSNAGAATWGRGASGVTGEISASNSLVGMIPGDHVGERVMALETGNYVVDSPRWDSGPGLVDVGAATWGSGASGTFGAVSTLNSLYGTQTNDKVANSYTLALTNGNYAVRSGFWDGGVAPSAAGAVTWGNGETGTMGPVGLGNSLTGGSANDHVGDYPGALLPNGDYVVTTMAWDAGPGATDVGAATWRSGATGTGSVGAVVGPANSLVGTTTNDHVSWFGITPLANGNYVVSSPQWDAPGVVDAGAATWIDGANPLDTVGPINATNSLTGTTASDGVGFGVGALTNGNYVVLTSRWDGPGAVDAGAATWGDGATGISGSIAASNSIIGTHPNDEVGDSVAALENGNYVVGSPSWNANHGAATWASGLGGTVGPVTSANSLVGTGNDVVARSIAPLPNGNYVVMSDQWNNGTATVAGAVTWSNGLGGTVGPVTAVNSLVGTATLDQVGTIIALPNSSYLVYSYGVDTPTATDAGALTFAGAAGITGTITADNSLIGTVPGDIRQPKALFTSSGSILVPRPDANKVTLLMIDLTPPTFESTPSITVPVTPGQSSAVVSYPMPAASDDVGSPTVSCTPPPGASFPIGTTTVTCTATNSVGLTAATSFTITVVADYLPLPPVRLADTRATGETIDGRFARSGVLAADTVLTLDVAGRGGVPVDAVAATLNVTVTEASADGYATVYPCGAPRPTASNLNYTTGGTIPNAVITKLGTGATAGQVCIYAQQALHLVVDVNGAFPPSSTYTAINPARLLDTRKGFPTIDGAQAGTGAAAAESVTAVQIVGRAGIPISTAAAVLNVTVTEPGAPGYATVYPCGTTPPTASNLNYTPGQTIPNLAIAKIGSGGSVCVYSQSPTHLVVDVLGYFPASTTYVGQTPERVLDTRPGFSTIDGQGAGAGVRPTGTVTVVHVAGRGGVSPNATTAVLNVTVTEPAAAGYATVYPCGIDPPLASNVNFDANQSIPNAVLTKIGTNGDVCIVNSQPTHLIADVTGYFP